MMSASPSHAPSPRVTRRHALAATPPLLGLFAALISCAPSAPTRSPADGSTSPEDASSRPPAASLTLPLEAVSRSTSRAMTAAPTFLDGYAEDCPASEDLSNLMASAYLKSMDRIEFAIFSDPRPEEQRMESVGEAASVLIGCIPATLDHVKELPEHEWAVFDQFLYELQRDVVALQVASIYDSTDEVEHWFGHVRQNCSTCHARFWEQERVEVSPTLDLGAEDFVAVLTRAGVPVYGEPGEDLDVDVGKLDASVREGGELFSNLCSNCHGLDRPLLGLVEGVSPVSGERFDRAGIRTIVTRMSRKPTSDITREDAAAIVEFLVDGRERVIRSTQASPSNAATESSPASTD